jgi:hypothetical protein
VIYRVAFSVEYQFGPEPTWVKIHTEPIHHLDFARILALTLRRRGFESVYIEEQDGEIWHERKEERILIDGRA